MPSAPSAVVRNTAMSVIRYALLARFSPRGGSIARLVGGLDEDLGSTRISAAISVGCVEMEIPNDPESVSANRSRATLSWNACSNFCIRIPPPLDCPVCRQQTLSGIRDLAQEFRTASV